MNPDYSIAALLKFPDYCAEKGLANPSTAQAWKVAAGRIFDDMSADEQADVRKIDIESAFKRFANKTAGKFSPASLSQYKARATSIWTEFLKYVENPSSYKPKGTGKPGKASVSKVGKNAGENTQNAKTPTNNANTIEGGVPKSPVSGLSLAFPLRSDFLAQVVIPLDLSGDEARRLGAFIATLAKDYKPD